MSTLVLHPATEAHKQKLYISLRLLEEARDTAHHKALTSEDDKAMSGWMRQYFTLESKILQLLPIIHLIETEGTLHKPRSTSASKLKEEQPTPEAKPPTPPASGSVSSELENRVQGMVCHLPAEKQNDINAAVNHMTRQYIRENKLTTEHYDEVLWYQLIQMRNFLNAQKTEEATQQTSEPPQPEMADADSDGDDFENDEE